MNEIKGSPRQSVRNKRLINSLNAFSRAISLCDSSHFLAFLAPHRRVFSGKDMSRGCPAVARARYYTHGIRPGTSLRTFALIKLFRNVESFLSCATSHIYKFIYTHKHTQRKREKGGERERKKERCIIRIFI